MLRALSSISLSSCTLSFAQCDIVKLHANTSSNKISSLFSGLVIATSFYCGNFFPSLIVNVYFGANFQTTVRTLCDLFTYSFLDIHMSYMILTAAYFSISMHFTRSLFQIHTSCIFVYLHNKFKTIYESAVPSKWVCFNYSAKRRPKKENLNIIAIVTYRI